ncbi:solute carrier family 41 member 1-like [Mytilus trossulus]|uniref:solute carrier family 41 member 1-like n=1 Tax=Mytilus trossulus TaxID=6551 RepID=UPI003005050F
MDKKGYDLRQRKNPPTKIQHPSIKKSVTHKRPKMEVDLGTIQMKDILKQENGTVNAGYSDEDEENTLFDQTPLLSRDEICASPDILIEEDNREVKVDESWWTIGLQVFFPFIIAGFGTVGAGMVLDIVQHWDVYTKVSEIFILVPSLLGLKGNLEMTLASRLSTQAHMGNMDKPGEKWKMIGGNMALVQAQAIVVGFLASLVAMVMGWIPDGEFNLHHALLLCASSMLTAAVASFVLGAVMVIVVLLSRRFHINPDNVATPIAASLGDLTTLSLLSGVSSFLFNAIGKQHWLAPSIIVLFLALAPIWIYISLKNKYSNEAIREGWTPVLSAMVISSVGGLILDFTVGNYHGIAVFQPVINGVGGNLVAVQASRITTLLHLQKRKGIVEDVKGCPNVFGTFCKSNVTAKATRVLLALVIPGHLIFMYTIAYMKAGHTSITWTFASFYLTAAFLQVIILLFLANWMVHLIWRLGDDPDNVAIPYLTAIGDLLGTSFLAVAFHLLYLIGDKDADVGE